MKDKIQILELFGGIGAPRCALRNLGVPVKAIDYVEIDEKAVRSYNAIFADELAYKTQTVVGYNLKPDILIHGSPCQDFSIAGHQKGAEEGSETRSSLMWETLHIIQQMGEWKPRIVIWENVKNVLSKHMIKNFTRYLEEMEKLGYYNTYRILDARDYGLPQARQRVFTVSTLDGAFNFDLMKRKPMQDISLFIDHDIHDERYIVKQKSVLDHIGESGINRATVIDNYAYTITCKQMRSPAQIVDLNNGKYRYLTERECWRLQGFSDADYEAAAKANKGKDNCMNGTLYKQAGNSMPVTVLESIFEVMLGDLYDQI